MSLELVKEAIRLNQPIGEESTQTIVENDIIVPDIKPDISRILLMDGDAYINSAEAASEKLLIGGTVRYKILYISDDPGQTVKSINTTTGFQYAMDIPNTRQGMQCRVKCDIEHIEYEIINSRKVNAKTIISLSGRVSNPVEQYIAQDFEGVEDIQVLKSTVSVNSYIGECNTSCPVKEILEIPSGKPPILEVLRNDVKISSKEFKPAENKIIANGELNISTLYIGDDDTRGIHSMEHEIPFTHLVDMDNVDENSICNMELRLGEMIFEAEEDADGELRHLRSEISLNVFTECYGSKDIELVEDAYSPSSRLSLEKEPLKMEEPAVEGKGQLTVKETVEIDEYSPEIAEVFNVLAKLSISGTEIMNDRMFIEGVLDCNILYLANNEEKPVYCIEREIPFRQTVDVKGIRAGMGTEVETVIEHCSYSMTSAKEVEVRFVLGLSARASSQIVLPVIAKASVQPLDDTRFAEQPSITIYFTQPGDTLWRIAKKYYTTVEELKRDNGCDNDDVFTPGQQILIPRKI